jgi:dTDP-4-amino-4,6-dideoxygalactose transaminase
MNKIPLFDFTEIQRQTEDEVRAAVVNVLSSGRFILGNEVSSFERELADFIGVPDVVGVASGTDALVLALKACDLKPHDAVIVPACSFMATASAVFWAGGIPVFSDVHPESGLMTPECLRAAIAFAESRGLKPVAVIPVDLYGRIPDMAGLREVANSINAPLIEDAAQALGSFRNGQSAGAHAPFAAFSFYPTKNLGGVGDGGALVVQNADAAERVRRMRNHGMTRRYIHPDIGTNSRLDEIQAAVLRVRLRHLKAWAEDRRRLRALYDAEIRRLIPRELAFPLSEPGDDGAALHLYIIRIPRIRDRVFEDLSRSGVECGIYYPLALPDQEAVIRRLPWVREHEYPGARTLAAEVLALPFFVGMKEEQVHYVVASLARSLGL